MALQLGNAWAADGARTPEGFPKQENEIWQRFLDAFGDSYELFYYQVRIGEDRFTAEELKDVYNRMVQDNALRKIDAVGKRGATWDLIEVRHHAGPGTIGQALTYENLWEVYAAERRPYTVNIVTDYMDVDTQLAAKARGLSVFIV
jgi:hypothetical protein